MKKWILNNKVDDQLATSLHQQLKIPMVISKLLVQRGVSSFEEAKRFFRPTNEDFIDPFQMLGMEKAVERIVWAIEKNEHILVYGDYDVDGTCSVTLMYLFLKELGAKVAYYQPDRYKEGYGISMKGVENAKKNNVGLIISLDCGVKAIEQSKKMAAYNIDLIICDHHLPDTELPVCVALLNPKQENCNYPFKDLCGCGVGFKLLQAICLQTGHEPELAYQYLDLVAIASAADIVPLLGENRLITKLGLELINSAPRPGIQHLLDQGKRTGVIETSDLVFAVAPRINAAGRLAHASLAVELLSQTDVDLAKEKALHIENINTERRALDQQITEEALSLLENEKDKVTTVVCKENWNKGVVGIVASRLMETYYRPTMVLCQDGDTVVGSVRSVSGFDVHAVLVAIQDLFVNFGGHQYAAGVTLKANRLEELKNRFEEEVSKRIEKEQLVQKIKIESILSPNDLLRDKKSEPYPKLYRLIEQLSPFGPGNMRPVFVMENLEDAGDTRIVGDNHLKLNVKQKGGNITLDGIAFNMGEYIDLFNSQQPVDLAFVLDKNEFKGRRSLQLRVRDIKESQTINH